jgi:hypothetical protein
LTRPERDKKTTFEKKNNLPPVTLFLTINENTADHEAWKRIPTVFSDHVQRIKTCQCPQGFSRSVKKLPALNMQ